MPQIQLPRDAASIRDNEVQRDRESTDLQFYGASFQKPLLPDRGTVEIYGYALAERDAPGFPTRNRRLFTPRDPACSQPQQSRIDYNFEGIFQVGRTRGTDAPGVRFDAAVDQSWSAMAVYRGVWLDKASDTFAATGVARCKELFRTLRRASA